jgi:MHS family alpha-ketoglutarate permease-like MFS transporter
MTTNTSHYTGEERSKRIFAIVGASSGNLVEWFDFYVYAFCAIYFAPAFFPSDDPTVQLLNTAGVFAAGFLMRPIGGWLFGRVADKHGRKNSMMISVLMMCAGSLVIAFLPTYKDIGAWAPALLLMARLFQGLSVGGEYGTTATYMSEVALKGQRGFFASFQYVTLIGGQLLAVSVVVILQQLLTEDELRAWGWRIPFVIGAVAAVISLLLRRSLKETTSKEMRENKDAGSIAALFRDHKAAFITVLGYTAGGSLIFYTFTTYMQKYLVNTVGMSISDSTTISAATLFLFMCLQPIVGGLSDKVGRRPILIAFGILGTLFTVPILTTLHTVQTWWGAFFLIMAALIIVSGYTSINAVVKAELFPTEIRALGVGLPYALTVSIFGGTAEYIALWFKSIGMETGYYWYVTACIAVSLLVYITMKDTRKHSRITTD